RNVTGVQTCALPILDTPLTFDKAEAIMQEHAANKRFTAEREEQIQTCRKEWNQLKEEQAFYQKELQGLFTVANAKTEEAFLQVRSEERRVGKECKWL